MKENENLIVQKNGKIEKNKLKEDGEKIDAPLFGGHSSKHRGNHRSHTRGKGIEAFFRSLWMKRYHK